MVIDVSFTLQPAQVQVHPQVWVQVFHRAHLQLMCPVFHLYQAHLQRLVRVQALYHHQAPLQVFNYLQINPLITTYYSLMNMSVMTITGTSI